jgi:hypothetical protein
VFGEAGLRPNASVDEFGKNFLQYFVKVSNVFQDLFGRFSMYTYVSDDQKKRGHPSQVSNALPTHGFVKVEDSAISAFKTCRFNHGGSEGSPCALKIGKDCLFISS